MDKKKMEKVLSVIMIVIVLLFSLLTVVNAAADDFTPQSVNGHGSDNLSTNSVQKLGNDVFNVIRVVGILVSVIMLVVLGIKYMMGSAEEKAEYKKTLMPYVIGALLIFAASTLSQILYNAFTTITAD